MIRECTFDDIKPFWREPEMWGDADFKPVSSMKYYDGVNHMGGNDMSVYDLNLSKPRFFILDNLACISYYEINNTIRVRGLFVKKEFRRLQFAELMLSYITSKVTHGNFMWALAGPNSMRVHEKCGFVKTTPQFDGDIPDGNFTEHHNCYMRRHIGNGQPKAVPYVASRNLHQS